MILKNLILLLKLFCRGKKYYKHENVHLKALNVSEI